MVAKVRQAIFNFIFTKKIAKFFGSKLHFLYRKEFEQGPWSVEFEDFWKTVSKLIKNSYDAILIAVAHNVFKKIGLTNIKNLCKKNSVIFDLKNLFNSNQVDFKL